MSPLEIEILLHYYARVDEYRDGDHTAPAVRSALDWFVRENVLSRDPNAFNRPMYRVTERGEALVYALCDTPLPECKWVIPERNAKEHR